MDIRRSARCSVLCYFSSDCGFHCQTGAREHQYLLAGPWVHIPWGDRIGTVDFGAEALVDTDTILLRWFDHWLKDSGAFAGKAHVRHFVLGENSWSEAETFPTEAEYALFLHSEGRANSRKGDGRLSPVSSRDDERCDIIVHDPEVPVIAPGGPAAASGPFDQASVELGNNLLVYSTEPLEKPLWIFGVPRVVLYCATSLLLLSRLRISLPNWCARSLMARRNLFVSELRGPVTSLWKRNTPRIKFTAGILHLTLPHAFLAKATASGWKSPAARFHSLTGTLGAMCLPAGRLRGIGGGRPSWSFMDECALPRCICQCPRCGDEFQRGRP